MLGERGRCGEVLRKEGGKGDLLKKESSTFSTFRILNFSKLHVESFLLK